MSNMDEIRLKARMLLDECSTIEELRVVQRIVRERWTSMSAQVARKVRADLSPGDTVEFTTQRGVVKGKIRRMLLKNIEVVEGATIGGAVSRTWRVHPTLLTKV